MEFDFRQELMTEEGEVDEAAASDYAEELSQRFAKSPEGTALAARGIAPGHYLDTFLHYAVRYVGASPAEMDSSDVRETLSVMAEKVTAQPEDFDRAIPELEAFCDFVGRAFAFKKAADWKRAIHGYAPEFRRAVRDPRQWGMAKSMMMEGLSRGYSLDTEEDLDRWFRTKQAEQLREIESGRTSVPGAPPSLVDRMRRALGMPVGQRAPAGGEHDARPLVIADLTEGESDFATPGSGVRSKRDRKREKSPRKQAKASRRQGKR